MAFLDEQPPKPLWRIISTFVVGWSALFLSPVSCIAVGMVEGGPGRQLSDLVLWSPLYSIAAGACAFVAYKSPRHRWLAAMFFFAGLWLVVAANFVGVSPFADWDL